MKLCRWHIIAIVLALSVLLFAFAYYSYNQKTRINNLQEYLNSYFSHVELVSFNHSNEKEISEFAFVQAIYNGMVHKTTIDGDVEFIERSELEENICKICGNSSLLARINYDYFPGEPSEDKCIVYDNMDLPEYVYIIHRINKVDNNAYEAVISYIDTNGNVTAYSNDGTPVRFEDVFSQQANDVDNGVELLIKEIKSHPQKYEMIKFIFKCHNDEIYYVDAEQMLQ